MGFKKYGYIKKYFFVNRLTAIVVDDFHLEANKTGSGLHVAFAGTCECFFFFI